MIHRLHRFCMRGGIFRFIIRSLTARYWVKLARLYKTKKAIKNKINHHNSFNSVSSLSVLCLWPSSSFSDRRKLGKAVQRKRAFTSSLRPFFWLDDRKQWHWRDYTDIREDAGKSAQHDTMGSCHMGLLIEVFFYN